MGTGMTIYPEIEKIRAELNSLRVPYEAWRRIDVLLNSVARLLEEAEAAAAKVVEELVEELDQAYSEQITRPGESA